jgi:tellurite resistance protein TerC
MVISFAFRSICTIFAGDMEVISMPVWAWILFYVLVLVMLVIDLKSFGRKGQHEVSVSEALKMTVVWIGVSLVFCGGIWLYEGDEKAMEFLAGYLIEKSLSMDNLFVFLMLFSFFGVQRKYQHEVLFWGIFGALVLRSIFIFAGTAIINQFEWILGVFGVFLIYTGIKMFGHQDDENVDPSKNIFVKLFKKFFPVTDQMHDDKFFITENGKRLATPLFIALLVIETTDVAFAVDSIPAVFSVSRDPFIVLTSNVFAILGLRALYFALAAVAKYFTYLKYGLGIILSFVGIKMLLEVIWHIEVPTPLSLVFIFGILVLSMGLSYIISKHQSHGD